MAHILNRVDYLTADISWIRCLSWVGLLSIKNHGIVQPFKLMPRKILYNINVILSSNFQFFLFLKRKTLEDNCIWSFGATNICNMAKLWGHKIYNFPEIFRVAFYNNLTVKYWIIWIVGQKKRYQWNWIE